MTEEDVDCSESPALKLLYSFLHEGVLCLELNLFLVGFLLKRQMAVVNLDHDLSHFYHR